MNKNIAEHIEHLQQLGKNKHLNIIIFTFMYQEVHYKCFYRLNGEEITVAPEGFNIAMNICIKNNELDNYFEEEVYQKLKEIHNEQLKTKTFCDNMLNAILNLTPEIVLKTSEELYRTCGTKANKYNENDKTYFYCWSRSHSGRKPTKKNLEKTRALFKNEEIYLICKLNNISSRWKDKPTKNSGLTSY